MGTIKYSQFLDLYVPYGGAFYIDSKIDLSVESVVIANTVAYYYA
jgi:hypothetical protein